MKFVNVLRKVSDACPSDCSACDEACSKRLGQSGPVIRASRIRKVGISKAITCFQCSDPACLKACPSDAIVKSEEDGVVRVISEQCVGCESCVDACPYENMFFSSDTGVAFKCDTCDGEPACVNACPHGVLELFRGSRIKSYMHGEELLSLGTGACTGCPGELGLRVATRVLSKDMIFFGCAGCVPPTMVGFDMKSGSKVTAVECLFSSVIASMCGVYRYYKHIGQDVTLVAFLGDGCVTDIEFQQLSGAAERGERILVICYDNEGQMATGIQRSSTTPLGASTTTSPVGGVHRGKSQRSKNVPLIMVSHRIPYVATASIAYLEDYVQKLTKAMNVKDGMAYIHLLSPCPLGWGAELDSGIELSRIAVQTNYFPLWEYEKGRLRITKEILAQKPIKEFTKLMTRFRHLGEEELGLFQESVNEQVARIKALSLIENL